MSIPDLMVSVVVVLILVAILGKHIQLSFRLGRRTTLPKSLLRLVALSLGTTAVWVILFYIVAFVGLLSSQTPDWVGVFLVTLGLPSQVKCGFFSGLPGMTGSSSFISCGVYVLLLMATGLYAVGLLPLLIGARTSSSKVGPHA